MSKANVGSDKVVKDKPVSWPRPQPERAPDAYNRKSKVPVVKTAVGAGQFD